MPVRHIITCPKKGDVEEAKKFVTDKGGKIVETYSIFPGFLAEMPEDSVSTFSSSPHIKTAELDGEVRTQ